MTYRHAAKSLYRTARRCPGFITVVTMTVCGSIQMLPVNASAAITSLDILKAHTHDQSIHSQILGDHYGSGVNNKNQININSPVTIHGIQHSNDGVINGNLSSQAAICKKRWRNCKIIQKVEFDP
jgi:hypothetical protein